MSPTKRLLLHYFSNKRQGWFITNFNTRQTQHEQATRDGNDKNHNAESHRVTNPAIDCDSAKSLTYSSNDAQRLTV